MNPGPPPFLPAAGAVSCVRGAGTLRFLLTSVAVFLSCPSLPAAIFEVGPGQPLATPSDVPWESLAAGDTVRIHWRAEPYRDKWVLCREGTAAQPITVTGVPGPDGERPVIDGNGATTRLALNYWNENRAVIKVGGASVPPDTTPTHIVIEGLEIRSGRPPYGFTDDGGTSQGYVANAAAIYVEKGEHITIRDCALHDCGNGLFTASSSTGVLVEGNHLFDNGNVGSIFEHNSYTEASGITFQYNRYGPLRDGAGGNNLKDRSAGTVIRYNWIEGGNRQLDLVDSGNSSLRQEPRYRETFVYGNVLVETDNSGNRQVVHYGGDSGNTSAYRKGTLHLYHNTIVSTRSGRTTLLRLSTDDETADCRNNIIFVTAAGSELEFLSRAGTLNLATNWLKPGTVDSFDPGFTGTITGKATTISGTDPGFLDLGLQNFRLAADADAIDAAVALHPATLAAHAPVREFRKPHGSDPRRPLGAPDLGAFAFSPYAAWRYGEFGPEAENDLVSGELADPDDDTIGNLLEFAFQLDPLVPSPGPLVTPTRVDIGPDRHFAIEFQRRPPPTGLLYTVDVSGDLVHWAAGAVYSDTQPPTTTPLATDATISGGPTRTRLLAPLEASPADFLRVQVAFE